MIPTFIVIGAPRAGTTSLYHYLRQHPQIAMSRLKETNYFTYLASQEETSYQITPNSGWPVKTWSEYVSMFDGGKQVAAAGEATPFYFYVPGVPKQIKAHLPDAKIILILRNPIDRAYSMYLKNRREGVETRSFESAVEMELKNPSNVVRGENFYVRSGLYFQHISRYLEYFERSRLHILFQEDLSSQPQLMLKTLFHFLGVDDGFTPDVSVRFNEAIPPLMVKGSSGRQRMKSITRRLREIIPQRLYYSLLNLKYAFNKKVASYQPLSGTMRLLLRDQYTSDIQNLEPLVKRNLSHWLAVE